LLERVLAREDETGKKKGSQWWWGALYRRHNRVGMGCERCHTAVRRGGGAAWQSGDVADSGPTAMVGWRGVSGSGPIAALTSGA
jgi:hypothetical protein